MFLHAINFFVLFQVPLELSLNPSLEHQHPFFCLQLTNADLLLDPASEKVTPSSLISKAELNLDCFGSAPFLTQGKKDFVANKRKKKKIKLFVFDMYCSPV